MAAALRGIGRVPRADARAGRHRRHQHRARADPDLRLGHRRGVRRLGRGHRLARGDRRRHRLASRAVPRRGRVPALHAPPTRRPRPAAWRPAPRHRPAGRRRVRPDGRLHVRRLRRGRGRSAPRRRPASASACGWCRRSSCRSSRSAFSVAPVAGQNVGARRFDRVRQTLRAAIGLSVAADARSSAVVCQFAAAAMVGVFSADPAVIAVGADYLRIVGLGFAASGIVFVTSSIFQALGRTLPPLLTSHRPQRRGVRAGPLAGVAARLRPARSSGTCRWPPSWSTPRPTSCSCSARSASRRRGWFPDRHAFAVP